MNPGELIASRYRVERLIARGGMGVVYEASHTGLNRKVALKILNPSGEHEEGLSFEERFRLEAETLAQLSHPHIVTIYDYGQTEDGRFFLALEYIDGPRLTDLLREGVLSPERAVGLVLQVCDALRYAHKRGVVHRDLKPSNLLIRTDDDGRDHVEVVDFGLVKVVEGDQSITHAGLVLGSPHCMAPEQVRGEDVDQRADIYALGVILFRCLAGSWPFHAEQSAATMVAHLQGPVPSLLEAAPQVPAALDPIVTRCMAKDPDQRYPTADALARDLRVAMGLSDGSPASGGVTESSTIHEVALTPALPAWVWALLGAGLVLFVGVALLFAWTVGVWRDVGPMDEPPVVAPAEPAAPPAPAQTEPADGVPAQVEAVEPAEVEAVEPANPAEENEPEAVRPPPSKPARPRTHKPRTKAAPVETPPEAAPPSEEPPAEAAPPAEEPPAEAPAAPEPEEETPPEGYMPLPEDL